MTFEISSKIPGYEFSREVDRFYSSCDDVEGYVTDELQDFFLDDALNQYTAFPCGFFNDTYSISAEICRLAEMFITSISKLLMVSSKRIDNSNTVMEQVNVDIEKLLIRSIEERFDCEQSYIYAGTFIEDCLILFVDKSIWQCGLKNVDGTIITDINKWPVPKIINGENSWIIDQQKAVPVLWYGLENEKPISRWTFGVKEEEQNLSFWFESDEWTIMEQLIEKVDESFLIWYTAECGRCAPDMYEIMKKCPIESNEGDTTETVHKKVNDYFIEQYNKNNASK